MSADVPSLVARLKRVARRLEAHAAYPAHAGLTDPDPGGTERWEAGQVWAHLAEFPEYWLDQARGVIAAPEGEPRPFGRTTTDSGRLAAIEGERRTAPIALFERARSGIDVATEVLEALPPSAWERVGTHPTLGPMSADQILERFLVAHLEEHADQLDLLAARAAADPAASVGLVLKRQWPVWSKLVEHRVDVELKLLTGSLRIDLDGQAHVKRSGWKMGMSGTEIPFDVDGRPCLLVVRQRYADTSGPEIDLYSEGRSLTDGSLLEVRREAHGREMPNLVRMLIIFLPVIGLPSVLRSMSTTGGAESSVWIVVVGAGIAIAAAGWVLARRWYRRGTEGRNRHLVGGAIVAACYAVFFTMYGVAVAIGR